MAIVEKVDQIEATLSAKQPTTERIYPTVVMSGPFPMNPSLASQLEELLAEKPRPFVGTDPRCSALVVLELQEIRMLLLTAAANDSLLTAVIGAWQSSPLRSNSFRDWLTTQSQFSVGRAQMGETWEEKVRGVFGPSTELDEVLESESQESSPQ